MTVKANNKKAKLVTPKAPPVVYVEICEQGEAQCVYNDPPETDHLDIGNRMARYKFDGFVTVEIKTVVMDVAA